MPGGTHCHDEGPATKNTTESSAGASIVSSTINVMNIYKKQNKKRMQGGGGRNFASRKRQRTTLVCRSKSIDDERDNFDKKSNRGGTVLRANEQPPTRASVTALHTDVAFSAVHYTW